MVIGGSLLVLKAGRYKTWTLNSGLDYGLHYMDSILDWNSRFGTFQGFPPSDY